MRDNGSPMDSTADSADPATAAKQREEEKNDDEGQEDCAMIEEVRIMPVSAEEVLPLPLDSGFAWVITFCGFMNSFFVDGIANSFGLLLAELCQHFQAEKVSVTVIGSLLCGTSQLVGPLVGSLVNKFGCRPVCMAGSLISAIAFVASSYCDSLWSLTCWYGLVGGIGFGMVYLPSLVCVNFYFERYRSLAMGLAVCGTGIGTVVMSPVTNLLLELVGWRNTLMILGGILLNCSVFGSLLRPNEPPKPISQSEVPKRERHVSFSCQTQQQSKKTVKVASPPHRRREETGTSALGTITEGEVINNSLPSPASPTNRSSSQKRQRFDSDRRLFSSTVSGINSLAGSANSLSDSWLRSLPTLAAETGDKRTRAHKKSKLAKAARARQFDLKSLSYGQVATAALSDLRRPLYRKDIFYSGSVASLAGHQHHTHASMLLLSMTRIPGDLPEQEEFEDREQQHGDEQKQQSTLSSEQMHDQFQQQQQSLFEPGQQESICCRVLPRSIVNAFKLMTDFSILRNSSFAIVCVANMLVMLAFHAPVFFVSDYANEIGVPTTSSQYLNSLYGASNSIGRILSGWLAGLPMISPIVINNASLMFCGICAALFNMCNSFPSLATIYALFGLMQAPFISLMSEILCQLVGLDRLTSAFGLVTLARGISTCVGSPLSASMYNPKTKYLLPFAMSSSLFCISGAVFSIILLPRFKQKRQLQCQQMEKEVQNVQSMKASLLLVEGKQLIASSRPELTSICRLDAAVDEEEHPDSHKCSIE